MAFVRVAGEEFGIRGRRTNISRIAAMTGIPRKDVSRIRQESDEYHVDFRIELSPLGDILHRWSTHPEFLKSSGAPRNLSVSEGEPSFSTLVKQCVGDVPAGAIKVELIRSGAVIVDENGDLVLNRRHVVPEQSLDKLVSSMSFGLRSLAETIAFNCNPDRTGVGRIERLVQTIQLDEEARQHLRTLLREKIVEYTEEMDNIMSGHEPPSRNTNLARVGVGIYYFEDPENP
jgi:hypothetical protein